MISQNYYFKSVDQQKKYKDFEIDLFIFILKNSFII